MRGDRGTRPVWLEAGRGGRCQCGAGLRVCEVQMVVEVARSVGERGTGEAGLMRAGHDGFIQRRGNVGRLGQ